MATLKQGISQKTTDLPLPFPVKRVYWVYNVPEKAVRGAHAHRRCEEYLVLIKGCLHIMVMDQQGRQQEHVLSLPGEGLYLPPGVWKTIRYGRDTILLVLASEYYDAQDYLFKEEFDQLRSA